MCIFLTEMLSAFVYVHIPNRDVTVPSENQTCLLLGFRLGMARGDFPLVCGGFLMNRLHKDTAP